LEAREELDNLNALIADLDKEPDVPDEWSYVWGKKDYEPQKYYKFYFRNIIPLPCLPLIWKTKCAMKHKVFARLLMMDRLNTDDNAPSATAAKRESRPLIF
jgi:hypothetical protein